MPKRIEYKFGQKLHPEAKLTFIMDDPSASKPADRRAFFLCECGNVKSTTINNVKRAVQKTCGCGCRVPTHGMSKSRVYGIWKAMQHRCMSKGDTNERWYASNGITVCERWTDSSEWLRNFIEDMGIPEDWQTLDRIDGTKGYFKDNCRWVDKSKQGFNKKIRNKSGCPGVYYDKRFNKWTANIGKDNKNIYLGSFNNKEEAINARVEAEIKYFGEELIYRRNNK